MLIFIALYLCETQRNENTASSKANPQYILWLTSPPTSQNCSQREKNLGKVFLFFFFFFSFDILKILDFFFYKISRISIKESLKLLKMEQISWWQPASKFPAKDKNLLGSVDHKIYWEWPKHLQCCHWDPIYTFIRFYITFIMSECMVVFIMTKTYKTS